MERTMTAGQKAAATRRRRAAAMARRVTSLETAHDMAALAVSDALDTAEATRAAVNELREASEGLDGVSEDLENLDTDRMGSADFDTIEGLRREAVADGMDGDFDDGYERGRQAAAEAAAKEISALHERLAAAISTLYEAINEVPEADVSGLDDLERDMQVALL